MTKKKLAIISSYGELCGNASYTKALSNQLSADFEVSVLALNVHLLRDGPDDAADNHVKDIVNQLNHFDYTNIQFEAGLFGKTPYAARKKIFRIINASPNLVITMHRVDFKKSIFALKPLLRVLKSSTISSYISQCRDTFINNAYANLYRDIISHSKKNDIPLIVHTIRTQELIKIHFNHDLVYAHPLCFYSPKCVEEIKRNYTKHQFCLDHNLNPNKIYLGIFGFLSGYKGYETILKAIAELPLNYHLLIFGRQHPHTIEPHEQVNPYIKHILDLIAHLNIKHRITFLEASMDEDFFKSLCAVDFNIIPYLEVNQGGSGVAALALESGTNSIFSQNLTFLELTKFTKNAFKMFSIGNHLELANAIFSYNSKLYEQPLKQYHQKYNSTTNAMLYKKALTNKEPLYNQAMPV